MQNIEYYMYRLKKTVHTSVKSEGDSMKKRNWILYGSIGIIILIMGICFFIFNSKSKEKANHFYDNFSTNENIENIQSSKSLVNDNNIDNTDVIITSYSKFKISPNTKIVFETVYNMCNHKNIKEEIVPKELVNFNEEELKNKYKDYEIKQFSVEKVILCKEIDEYCGNHFLLKESEGVVAIYKVKNDGSEELMDLTDISIQYLTETDKLKLQSGIKIYGQKNLDKALEDFE